jgi:conjugal transfer pilin signal peptidase TrbI
MDSDAAAPRPARSPMSLKAKLGIVLAGCVAFCAYGALKRWHDHHAFVINVSESLPNWAFLVTLGQFPQRGDYVLFDPGHDPLTVKHFGAHPAPFAKLAYGLPGDVVGRAGDQVLINGHVVARLKPLTKQGEPLTPGPLGIVPRGCVFAGSPHKDGFDSRYQAIGFVCADRLLGVGKAVL